MSVSHGISLAAIASLVLLLIACRAAGVAPQSREPKVTDQERADNRRALFNNMVQEEGCYMGSLDYAIREPEFLERVLTRLLAGRTLDDVIASDKNFTSEGGTYLVAAMMREAPQAYAKELRTADGLRRLEELLADRFAHPHIEMGRNIVKVDYGHIAAKLRVTSKDKIEIAFDESPHLDPQREWQTKEMADAVAYQLKMHPGADGVELRIVIPGAPKDPLRRYTYLRATDRIAVSYGNESPAGTTP